MATRISDEFGATRQSIEAALSIKKSFVRNDVQISIDNQKAKGRRISAVEVLFNFGISALETLLDRGAYIIQNRNNASSNSINYRIKELNISVDRLADRIQASDRDIKSYLLGEKYFPIKKLELTCALLGLEEARISAYKNNYPQPHVRLRYYDDKRGDVNVFDEKLVDRILSQSWKIGKIEYLMSLISASEKLESTRVDFIGYIDPDYHVAGANKPTVEKGKRIASKLREGLNLKPARMRAVRVTDALKHIGSSFFSDDMSEAFCGMTLISGWSGTRVVVANTQGENAHQTVRRFTLAHELAHAASDPEGKFVAVKVGGSAGRSAGSAGTKGSKDLPEMRANSFAANFLAPDDEIRYAINARSAENAIDVVCDEFVISRSAAKWRLVSLGAIGNNYAPGQEDTLFRHNRDDLGDTAPSVDDSLKKIALEAEERNLIHNDTYESLMNICEKATVR